MIRICDMIGFRYDRPVKWMVKNRATSIHRLRRGRLTRDKTRTKNKQMKCFACLQFGSKRSTSHQTKLDQSPHHSPTDRDQRRRCSHFCWAACTGTLPRGILVAR